MMVCRVLGGLEEVEGFKGVNISLDTLVEEKFEKITRRRGMEKVIKNIFMVGELNKNEIQIMSIYSYLIRREFSFICEDKLCVNERSEWDGSWRFHFNFCSTSSYWCPFHWMVLYSYISHFVNISFVCFFYE